MKIEIWSDYACPFCYIGKTRLEKALEETGKDVEIEFKSFQLDPTMEEGVGLDPIEYLAGKYGVSMEKANGMIEQMLTMAKADGLNYDFENLIETNTLRAHRLNKFAEANGKGSQMNKALFEAHLIDGRHIGSIDELVKIAEEVGLDGGKAREVLGGSDYTDEVLADINKAREYGISSVPFFVFDGKYAVQGAQESAMFVEALNQEGNFK